MKVILVGDLHLSDRAPSSRTETYTDDLFDKLEEVNNIAVEVQAKAIIFAGDLFHIKSPTRNSHRLVLRFINWAKSAPCEVMAVAGNHDISYDRYDTLSSGQPLGVVFASGAVKELVGWTDSLPIYGLPWLQHWDDENEVMSALCEWHNRSDGFSSKSLVVTHAPFFPPGKEPPYEFFPTTRFSELLGAEASVFYGHIHDPHGVYKVNSVNFCNNGALSRGSLTENEVTRGIYVTVYDFDTGVFSSVPVPHKLAEEVFLIEEVTERRQLIRDSGDFIESLGETVLSVTGSDSFVKAVKEKNLPLRVEEVAIKLLEKANDER